jgi:hypothetical protein
MSWVENCGDMSIVLERDNLTALALALEATVCGVREDSIRDGLRQVIMLNPCREEVDRLGRLC